MTDELLYERLAMSVSQLGSPLPHVHGELIPNLNQLYPLLIAPAFSGGLVPGSLDQAHALNAWIMSSACIPAFLLARRVTGRRLLAYALALLTVCLPWIVLSSFLLTEVVGYPAFLWAVLAIQAAIASPSRRNDVLALLGIGLAVFARTQFELLLIVLPVALLAVEVGRGTACARRCAARRARRRIRRARAGRRRAGRARQLLARARDVPRRARGAARARRSRAVVPRAHRDAGARARDPAVRRRHRLAAREHGASARPRAARVRVPRHGHGRRGRARGDGLRPALRRRLGARPLPLLRRAARAARLPLRARRRRAGRAGRCIVPTALVAAGFALDHLPVYGIFHADSPVAVLHDRLRDWLHLGGARALLGGGTVSPWRCSSLSRGSSRTGTSPRRSRVLTLVVLPLESAYAFKRLFDHNGTSGRAGLGLAGRRLRLDRPHDRARRRGDARPLSRPAGRVLRERRPDVGHGVLEPLDRARRLPPRRVRVDAEHVPEALPTFDPATGRASISPTRYVAQSDKETRFRIAGNAVSDTRGVVADRGRAAVAHRLAHASASRRRLDAARRARDGARLRRARASAARGHPLASRSGSGRPRTSRRGRSSSARTSSTRAAWPRTARRLPQRSTSCVPAGGYADYRIRRRTPRRSTATCAARTRSASPARAACCFTQIALADEVGAPVPRAPLRLQTSRTGRSRRGPASSAAATAARRASRAPPRSSAR